MELFARTFLLLGTELAVGGLLALSLPPFHEVARGYYKSTASVYFGLAVLVCLGRGALLWNHPPRGGGAFWEFGLLALFAATTGGYLATLWGERDRLRARCYVAAWSTGLANLALAARWYPPPLWSRPEVFTRPLAFALSAVVLGTAASGMLLGHWYLIEHRLSLVPLKRMLAFFTAGLAAQAVFAAALCGTVLLLGPPAPGLGLAALAAEHPWLAFGRFAVSPCGAGVLAVMIWRTLEIPQTMAATGLFYIALLAVLVGEFMGRLILFRTGLPL